MYLCSNDEFLFESGCYWLLGNYSSIKSSAALCEILHVQIFIKYNFFSINDLPYETPKKSFCQMIIDSARVQYRVHWGLSNYT